MNPKILITSAFLIGFFHNNLSIGQESGKIQKWHRLTLDFEGPQTFELALPNPFTYYRLDVTFTHEDGFPILKVPGFYAADGNAQNTSSAEGKTWRVHFSPSKTGTWKYVVSFKAGENVALKTGGVSAGFMDGKMGHFTVSNSDKTLPDNRAKGRLQYVGRRYLEWAETGQPFLKVGADSPENMLHYQDFDATLDDMRKLDLVDEYRQLLKTWEPHAQDFEPSANAYTWQNGKGKNILGAVNYLSSLGLNAFSFLTNSADGDDGFVYPFITINDSLFLANHKENRTWERALYHNRFDVSKLAQWEQVFEYADTKGMFLHFKTFENENVSNMGKHELTNDRKLYYRELIARFAHHLALNWNLSEETNVDINVVRETASYIRNLDPYKNHVVQHTFPIGYPSKGAIQPNFDYYHYNLLGFQSELTGLSLQLKKKDIHEQVVKWVSLSEQSGRPWAIANDEQGEASEGATVDATYPGYTGKLKLDNADEMRHKVFYATLMGGGYGVEYYYGYQTEASDLHAQDHRTREVKYKQAVIAKKFFENLDVKNMNAMDEITSTEDDFVFGNHETIVVYMPKGGTSNISLSGLWNVEILNPITGELATQKTNVRTKISAPDRKQDWVIKLTRI